MRNHQELWVLCGHVASPLPALAGSGCVGQSSVAKGAKAWGGLSSEAARPAAP